MLVDHFLMGHGVADLLGLKEVEHDVAIVCAVQDSLLIGFILRRWENCWLVCGIEMICLLRFVDQHKIDDQLTKILARPDCVYR